MRSFSEAVDCDAMTKRFHAESPLLVVKSSNLVKFKCLMDTHIGGSTELPVVSLIFRGTRCARLCFRLRLSVATSPIFEFLISRNLAASQGKTEKYSPPGWSSPGPSQLRRKMSSSGFSHFPRRTREQRTTVAPIAGGLRTLLRPGAPPPVDLRTRKVFLSPFL